MTTEEWAGRIALDMQEWNTIESVQLEYDAKGNVEVIVTPKAGRPFAVCIEEIPE